MAAVGCLSGKLHGKLRQQFLVAGSEKGPGLGPLLQVFQLDAKDCPLKTIHAVVVTDLGVVVALVLGVVAQGAEPAGDLVVGGNDGTALAERAQVLAGIETEAAAQAKRSSRLVLVLGAVGL